MLLRRRDDGAVARVAIVLPAPSPPPPLCEGLINAELVKREDDAVDDDAKVDRRVTGTRVGMFDIV